jgi:peptidoglycan/LPS O-acetylase OafA/YrhL
MSEIKYRNLLFILFFIFLFFFSKGGFNRISNNYLFSIILIFLFIGFYLQEPKLGINKFLQFLGKISYSIFLNHLIVIDLIKRKLIDIHFTSLFVCSFVVSVAIAYITYSFIEQWLSKQMRDYILT